MSHTISFRGRKGMFFYVSDNNSPPAHWNGELSVSNDGRGYSPARSTAKKRGRGALGEIGALQEEHFFVIRLLGNPSCTEK